MRTCNIVAAALATASLCLGAAVPAAERLNADVYQYASLQLDTAAFFTPAQRFARDVQGQHSDGFNIPLRAYGRNFNLKLNPDHNMNRATVKIVNEDGSVEHVDTSGHHYFRGTVDGKDGTFAHCRLLPDGTVWGAFVTGGEGYHIEPSHYYPSASQEANHIIYRLSDIEIFNPNPAIPRPEAAHFDPDLNHFIPQAEQAGAEGEGEGRQRRAAAAYVPGNTACKVSLHADHTFYAGPGASSTSTTLDQVYARWLTTEDVFDQYTSTSPGFAANPVRVQIGELVIYKTASGPAFNTLTTTDGQLFLEEFSKTDWSAACVAHLLTNIDFDSGLLGLAWVGTSTSTPGGICQGEVSDKWTNTGFSTSKNFGTSVSTLLSGLVMAHEISHNFGSGHDLETGESAGDADGRFLMWPLAIDGTQDNNNKFSQKSLDEINGVIAAKGGCFVPYVEMVCGNSIQENTEKCDCGGGDAASCDEIDACCSTAKDCVLRAGKACSPKHLINGVCCTEACAKEPDTKVCRASTECTREVKCNNGECDQVGGNKAEGLLCNGDAKYCKAGSCSESICKLWDMAECSLSDTAAHKCAVACMQGATCKAVDELGVTINEYNTTDGGTPTNTNPGAVKKPPNSPCEFTAGTADSGYCNADQECVDGDTEGGLFDGLDKILNKFINFAAIREWLLREDVKGVPNYAWIIMGSIVLILICAFGCCRQVKKKQGAV